jgi:hypothetical protein
MFPLGCVRSTTSEGSKSRFRKDRATTRLPGEQGFPGAPCSGGVARVRRRGNGFWPMAAGIANAADSLTTASETFPAARTPICSANTSEMGRSIGPGETGGATASDLERRAVPRDHPRVLRRDRPGARTTADGAGAYRQANGRHRLELARMAVPTPSTRTRPQTFPPDRARRMAADDCREVSKAIPGLIHSDGWRGVNRVHVKGRDYEYPRATSSPTGPTTSGTSSRTPATSWGSRRGPGAGITSPSPVAKLSRSSTSSSGRSDETSRGIPVVGSCTHAAPRARRRKTVTADDMRAEGLEPPWPFGHQDLNLARNSNSATPA